MVQEDETWVHAIIYTELNGKLKFVRSINEFFNKFELIENE
jgi:hypothetical protein